MSWPRLHPYAETTQELRTQWETLGDISNRARIGVTSLVNVLEPPYSAIGDGTVDDTAAVQAAQAAAAAMSPPGLVYFPGGHTYKMTAGLDITGQHGISFAGDADGSSVIDIANATMDLFSYTAGTNDVTIRDLAFTSSVARTAGWVIRGNFAYNAASRFLQFSRLSNLNVKNQVNGFWFPGFRYIWLHTCFLHGFVGTGGVGIKFGQAAATDVNQGVEAHLRNVHVVGQNLYTATGADPTLLDYGFWIEDCDGVYLEECHGLGTLENLIYMKAGAHGLYNHFFINSVMDVTRNGHVVKLDGTGTIQWIDFHGGYYASGGLLAGGSANARGFSIEVPASKVKIQGARIRNNKGTGIYIDTTGSNDALISHNQFSENGSGAQAGNNFNIWVDVGSGERGPTIHDNQDSVANPSNGVGLSTSSTSARISVRDNSWPSGWTYGVTPEDSDGNRTPASSTIKSTVATVATTAVVTEETLWTMTLRGGTFSRDGQSGRVTAWGTFAANANAKTARFYIGANVITINNATANPNGVQWYFQALFCRTGAATGKRVKTAIVGVALQDVVGTAGLAETWANDVVIKITGQNGVANAGDINIQHVLWEPILDC